jgi:hypothetical protein
MVIGAFGLFLVVFGLIVVFTNLDDVRRRRRILDTPTSPIARAPGGAPVEIKGSVVTSEEGVVRAPLSGRDAVWFRVVVQEHRSRGRSGSWRTVVDEREGRAFLVDDGSGQRARVAPAGAHVVLDRDKIATSGTFEDAPPSLEAFLRSRGLTSTSWLGFNKAMRFEEEVLAPGDPIYALGPSRRVPGPPVHDGYRMAPGTELLLVHEWSGDGELLLTNKTEDELTRNLLVAFVVGALMAAAGAAMIVAALAVR